MTEKTVAANSASTNRPTIRFDWRQLWRPIRNAACLPFQRIIEAWRNWRNSPQVDMFDTHDRVELRINIPGVDSDDISVEVRGKRLIIGAMRPQELLHGTCRIHERPNGLVTRTLRLPYRVNDAEISVLYRDGVLEISVPRKKAAQVKVERTASIPPTCEDTSDASMPY